MPRQIGYVIGSLRKESINRKLANALIKLAPPDFLFKELRISDLPLYNQDDDKKQAPEVQRLKSELRAVDAVMFVTAEYNRSIPGVLKNMLDWMSRPPEPPFAGKVVGIIGASPGPVGTGRVQYDLRKVMVFLDAFTVNKPEVMINHCAGKFDAQGQFTDEAGGKFIVDLLLAMQSLKRRLG